MYNPIDAIQKPVFSLAKIRDNTTKIYLYQQIMFSFHRSYFEIDFGSMCIGTDCQT